MNSLKKILFFILLFSGIASAQWLSHTQEQIDSLHSWVYDVMQGGDLDVVGDINNFDVNKFTVDATWDNKHTDIITTQSQFAAGEVQSWLFEQVVNNPLDITSWGQKNLECFTIKRGAGDITTAIIGFSSLVWNDGSGDIAQGIGANYDYWSTANVGTVASYTANNVATPYMPGTSTVTTFYGSKVDAIKSAKIGIAYAYYSAGVNDLNYFAGDFEVGKHINYGTLGIYGTMGFADSSTTISASQNVHYPITNTWNNLFIDGIEVGDLVWTGDSVQVTTAGNYEINWDLSFSGTNTDEYHISIWVNNVEQDGKGEAIREMTTSTIGVAAGGTMLTISATHWVSLRIKNINNDNDPIVVAGNFTIKKF